MDSAGLLLPKLVTCLREGYGPGALRADLVAGLTVAIVALPLSMAIAIASGVTPDRGLYTAIVGGFIISLLGGSRYQIGGPAGAFIVLVAACVDRHGVGGLELAALLGGLILLAVGFARLGTFIKYIPYPVTVGFTAGIAVIILASQLHDLFGLTLPGKEPGPLAPKLLALGAALPTASPGAVIISLFSILLILGVRRWRPQWPAFLITVALASLAALVLTRLTGLPVETIGSRFGGIPRTLPLPHLPPLSPSLVIDVLPDALAFALLGGIESLLSAVVADGMSGRRHRSNMELVAQGAANIASALFGGICVTGAIARTATNVRSGAVGPVAGIAHALFLLIFMAVAAPLARYIPLPALAAVLVVVAWNMAERHAFAALLRGSRGDGVVLLATFLLTIFRDLTMGILVGVAGGSLLFIHRMAQTVTVEATGGSDALALLAASDIDNDDAGLPEVDKDIFIFKVGGAFFFGAAAAVSTLFDRLVTRARVYVLDLSAVPMLDSTGVITIEGFARKAAAQGALLIIAVHDPVARRLLLTHGVRPPRAHLQSTLTSAIALARRHLQGLAETADDDDPATASGP